MGEQFYKRGDGKKAYYYTWDYTHGHWELYTRKGVNRFAISNDDVVLKTYAFGERRRVKL